MTNYRIDISKTAESDLSDIISYIAKQLYAPETALELLT